MPSDREVELKFLCAPEDLGCVLAAAPPGDDESHELISVYFDTPDHTLQKAGASLRVRESEGRRMQTLKRGEGLSREEHEAPIAGVIPDPGLGPLKALLGEDERLKPAFNVRVTRRQRLVAFEGAQIELAVDLGEVRGGRRSSPISEVELELKAGPPEALFALARELGRAAPLFISFDGKASRGQALVAGAALPSRRADQVRLSKKATVAEAFQAIARNAVGQICANAVVLRERTDPEAVHQLRVAARRLRSALSTFAPVLGGGALHGLKTELKWLAGEMDAARNLDVYAAGLAGPALAPRPAGVAALRKAVESARATARAQVLATVTSERFRTLGLELSAWTETGAWLGAAAAARPAKAFARKALAKRTAKLRKRGRRLARADDATRHRLRIEAKKLRYAAEGFRSLFPAAKARRYLGRLKALQETLGTLNDIATAERLVGGLTLSPAAAFAAGELAGLRAATASGELAAASKAFRALARTRPFFA